LNKFDELLIGIWKKDLMLLYFLTPAIVGLGIFFYVFTEKFWASLPLMLVFTYYMIRIFVLKDKIKEYKKKRS
jgi:hypothetical protein